MNKAQEILNLIEALKPVDKQVVDAFYDHEAKEGKMLRTDGKVLVKMGMGGEDVAVWDNNKIKIISSQSVKSDEWILNYMKKSIPKNILADLE